MCCNNITRREFITGNLTGKVEGKKLSEYNKTDFLNKIEVKRLIQLSKE